MSIQQYLDKIKNAVYGREVRGAIHDAIKQTYDDAIENGDTDMEVAYARGSENTLGDRLDKMDNSISDKASIADVNKKIDKGKLTRHDLDQSSDSNKWDINDMNEDTRAILQGLEPGEVNAVLGDNNVTMVNIANNAVRPVKTSFIEPKGNLLKVYDIKYEEGTYISGTTGGVAPYLSQYSSTDFIPVEEGKNYWFGGSGAATSGQIRYFAWYDSNKNYISGSDEWTTRPIQAPSNAAYFRGSFLTASQETGSVPLYFIESSTADNSNGFRTTNYFGSDDEYEKFIFKNNVEFPEILHESQAMVTGIAPVIFDFKNLTVSFSYNDRPYPIPHRVVTRVSTYNIPKKTLVIEPYGGKTSSFVIVYDKTINDVKLERWNYQFKDNDLLVAAFTLVNESVVMNGDFRVINSDDIYITDIKNPLRYDLEDSSYSWWISPLAVRFNRLRDKSYLGYTDSMGHTGVASINNDSGVITKYHLKKYDSDDHNATSINIRPDGRLLAIFSSGHNKDSFMRVRISKKPESVEEWEDEIPVYVEGNTTYAQTFFKNGTWYCFFRRNGFEWSVISSGDGGETWSDFIPIVKTDNSESVLYYMKVTETTDANVLRLNLYGNPNGNDTNIRQGFLHVDTGEIRDSDNETVIGNLSQSQPLSETDFSIVIPIPTDRKHRLLDVAVTSPNDTKIAYTEFEVIEQHKEYVNTYVIYHNGTKYNVVDAGQPFGLHSNYVGGVVFDTRNHDYIYLSRQANPSDWRLEQWKFENNEWIMSQQIKQSSKLVIRPTFEINGDKLFWQEGTYLSGTGVNGFQNDIHYQKIEEL